MTIRDLSRTHALLLSLGTALTACSPAIGDYASELEEAVCDWEHACHLYERRSDCIDARVIDRDPEFDYLQRAAAAGNVEYDADAAAACLDAIRERGCTYEDLQRQPEVCDDVFRGRVGRNAPCLSSAECAGDAVCGFDPACSDDMCCVGACRVFADPIAVGEPCGFGGVGCVEEAFCATDPVTFQATVCTKRVKIGGDCSLGEACVDGAACDGEQCRKIDLRAPGEPCDQQFVDCAEPGRCRYTEDAGAICVVDGKLGAPCTREIGCGDIDSYCDDASGLCTLLPGHGQACVDGYQCAAWASCYSLYVDQYDAQGESTCVRRAGLGDACSSGDDSGPYVACLGDLQCDAGRCVLPPVVTGEQCAVPTD